MSDQNNLEIYKQRYDTFRHLDRLRWQMFQIAVGAAALILGIGGTLTNLRWVSWVVIGLIFFCLGFAKLKIGNRVVMNSKILREFGKAVGDVDIPEATKKDISFRIARILMVFGVICFICGIAAAE